jgi:PTH1 family peptidyl-tRNA hydrolase
MTFELQNYDALFVCIGNYGEHYKYTRHNTGSIIGGYITNQQTKTSEKSVFQQIYIKDKNFLFCWNLDYVNNTGDALLKHFNKSELQKTQIFVIYDDTETLLGKWKDSIGSGAGGHNGIRNLNTKNISFVKIKVGIGRPPEGQDLNSFVLGSFNTLEIKTIEGTGHEIFQNIDFLLDKYKNKI